MYNGLLNEAKQNPQVIQEILYPGKQLCDIDISKLTIEVLPSGFRSLDISLILKKKRGELIIIGARPGIGKSALGFQIATNVARYGKSHIFSLEMDHESIAARQMAAILNKPLDHIQSGKADQFELETARKALSKLNCVISDKAGRNVYEIADAARQQNKKSKTDLVVVDYMQIVATESGHNRSLELAKVSFELKALAKELRAPVIALSQLNRSSEFREGGEPQLSDLKESSALEQDADVVILIHRPKENRRQAKIIIAKHRNGPTGEIEMEYAEAQTRFLELGSTAVKAGGHELD